MNEESRNNKDTEEINQAPEEKLENGQNNSFEENVAAEKEEQEVPEEETLSETEQLEADLAASKDKYLRLYSEFENFRRRTAKERMELIKTANEDLITEMLPVKDDFERALKALEENSESGHEDGMRLIYNKFSKVLEQKGLKVIETGTGGEFDTEIHDAITQIPAPEENLKGKIVDVIEKGYYLNDKVIRYAKVVIGS